MNKNENSTIIDLGFSKIRFGVFDKNLENLYSQSKNISKINNNGEYYDTINFLIRDAEKKISNHLKNVIVMYDDSQIFSIDLSIKRNFDQKFFFKDLYPKMILEANQLVKNNYINKKILHVITTKFNIDGEEYINPNKTIEAKSIIIEIKFICLPNEKYIKISNIFKKCNIQILNFFCSSYIKSLSYNNSFNKNNDLISFLDIGFERSTLTTYFKKKLYFINCIAVGSNHISKDISNILKISLTDSEMIKKAFTKSEIEFSYDSKINNEKKNLIKELVDKNISVDLLKKVVLARIEEIIELQFKVFDNSKIYKDLKNSILVLTGNGSKLFNKNSFHLDNKYKFKEISFYEESDLEICRTCLNYKVNTTESDIEIVEKYSKKTGIFEKFFNFFSS